MQECTVRAHKTGVLGARAAGKHNDQLDFSMFQHLSFTCFCPLSLRWNFHSFECQVVMRHLCPFRFFCLSVPSVLSPTFRYHVGFHQLFLWRLGHRYRSSRVRPSYPFHGNNAFGFLHFGIIVVAHPYHYRFNRWVSAVHNDWFCVSPGAWRVREDFRSILFSSEERGMHGSDLWD